MLRTRNLGSYVCWYYLYCRTVLIDWCLVFVLFTLDPVLFYAFAFVYFYFRQLKSTFVQLEKNLLKNHEKDGQQKLLGSKYLNKVKIECPVVNHCWWGVCFLSFRLWFGVTDSSKRLWVLFTLAYRKSLHKHNSLISNPFLWWKLIFVWWFIWNVTRINEIKFTISHWKLVHNRYKRYFD